MNTAHLGPDAVALELQRHACRQKGHGDDRPHKAHGEKEKLQPIGFQKGFHEKHSLQQDDTCFLAEAFCLLVPQGGLYLADMRLAQQQHAQAALADAPADGQGELAV